MLAQSAVRAGWRPWVLDLYGDEDTRACSEFCEVDDGLGGFDHARVLAELRRAAAEGATGLVYGGGVECAADWLEEMAAILPVWGNSPEVVRLLKSPPRFFRLLDELAIPYPESRFQPPECADGWLVKPGCGEGGKGVAFCAAASGLEAGNYFQRYIAGMPMSALFLADGKRACLVGFNELWTNSAAGQPFGFAGASNRPDLPRPWRERLADWLGRLARRVGLKGLNSLDFVFDGCGCWVLEVNPRPSATLALYDADFPEGLLAAHVRACGGELPEGVPAAPPRAMRIVYAPNALCVPDKVAWPEWCGDLPMAASEIAAGQPLCSLAAEGEGLDLLELLLKRERVVLALCPSR